MKDILLFFLLLGVMLISMYDLVVDSADGASTMHLAAEAIAFLLATILVVWLVLDLRKQRLALEQLRHELASQEKSGAEAPPELAEIRQQLGNQINKQFQAWELTDSEKAVGLLLLKGLSFREIAAVRETREKTVRAQASSVYRKANVSGRHAFSAWFIEDFL